MEIRPATLDDAAGMATVQVRSWQAGYQGIVPQPFLDAMSIEERTAMCARYLDGQGIAFLGSDVAVEADDVIGFISWTISRDVGAPLGTAEVASFYVAPGSWRCGAGRALLAPGLARARRDGYRTATLWVLADNVRGRAFYEATGWAPDGTTTTAAIGGVELNEVRYAQTLSIG